MVTISIDGIRIDVHEGTTVLEAARGLGIAIPTLCHNPGLSPYGACRVCIVEVNKGNRSTLEASCTLAVSEGLVVVTNSERVRKNRKVLRSAAIAGGANGSVRCASGRVPRQTLPTVCAGAART
jgi:bidirectional [NiFe] hydrogenase diaphorase subunit